MIFHGRLDNNVPTQSVLGLFYHNIIWILSFWFYPKIKILTNVRLEIPSVLVLKVSALKSTFKFSMRFVQAQCFVQDGVG